MTSAEASAAEQVFRNPFFIISLLDERIVCLVRTATRFASAEEIQAGCEPVQRELDRLGRAERCLLVDTRLAVGNNDPTFESNFAAHRRRMAERFERVALLVQTVIGKLHNERLIQEDRLTGPRVFTEWSAALAYLREAARTRKT